MVELLVEALFLDLGDLCQGRLLSPAVSRDKMNEFLRWTTQLNIFFVITMYESQGSCSSSVVSCTHQISSWQTHLWPHVSPHARTQTRRWVFGQKKRFCPACGYEPTTARNLGFHTRDYNLLVHNPHSTINNNNTKKKKQIVKNGHWSKEKKGDTSQSYGNKGREERK